MNRYYNLKTFSAAVVKAHAAGEPFNPLGAKSFGLIYTYRKVEGEYKGRVPLHGNRIMAMDVQAFVAAINTVLDAGGKADGHRAFKIRGAYQLPVDTKAEIDATEAIETPITTEDVAVEPEAGITATDDTSNDGADSVVEESPEAEAQESAPSEEAVDSEAGETSTETDGEIQTESENEASQETSESESAESGQTDKDTKDVAVDWVTIESYTKKQIDKYAESMGIKLDGRKNKKDLITQFKELVDGSND